MERRCKCGKPARGRGQSYCLTCHAAYMRAHRPKHHELTPEQRQRADCRTYTKVLQARGKLPKLMACELADNWCDGPIQNHHPDYTQPRRFQRVCRVHHRRLHASH